MAQASNYLENKLIDHLVRSGTFAKPAALFVALLTAAPTDAGGGTEVTGGGYARVALPPADTNWTATQGGISGASTGTSGATSNAVVVTFPAPTADWGTAAAPVTHFGLYDAATAGNLLVFAPLTTAREILAGDPAARFQSGALQITVS